ncbi:conserved protein of unknown function; putative membrane protein [Methylorubrum extorquens DM4]|uniref:DUF2232 domain-containing protein n=1 Tax=Methylorubrum extorquens (strain DSM 6343 / CIP 106787 / DM4) TaxID=661410 RepID=C7CIB5_METED|nr:DUF2232 domain-containing protein [Methylorubrum extorquens]CAX26546.1 conserved protein of unknown function; putative membrane protein [Methylorubrum extorquens DM4]
MTKDIPVGAGAGLVAALLFGVLLKATTLSILLYLLAPLPILIVGLGWSHRAALAAVVSGGLALALFISPYLGLAFAAYLAIPAWWLAYLALLGRPNADGTIEWYPTGRLLAWVAGTAALAFIAIAVIASPDYDTFRAQLTTMSRRVVQVQVQRGRIPAPPQSGTASEAPGSAEKPAETNADGAVSQPPGDAQTGEPQKSDDLASEVADALATVAPAIAAQGLTILFTFYLWAAARIVQISGRLLRPWPDLPSTMMPRSTLLVFAAALTLAMVPGYPGALGIALIGAFSAAFALQGLAAFHDRSRGRPGRFALLAGLYVLLFLTQGVAMLALILFGIADTALDRRRPKARGDA